MAERRMFTKKVIGSDDFLKMPISSQGLYFQLAMQADDDGFLNNSQTITNTCGASASDFSLLVSKRFILTFDNGIVVIKHWRMHNLLRKDRYTPTQYIEEKESLVIKADGSYTEKTSNLPVATKWQPNGNQMATEGNVEEVNLGKINVGKVVENALDESQKAELIKIMGADKYRWYVDKLANFILNRQARVKSCYETILKWYEEDSQASKKKAEKKKVRYGNFDPAEAFQKALERSYADLTEEDSGNEQSDT